MEQLQCPFLVTTNHIGLTWKQPSHVANFPVYTTKSHGNMDSIAAMVTTQCSRVWKRNRPFTALLGQSWCRTICFIRIVGGGKDRTVLSFVLNGLRDRGRSRTRKSIFPKHWRSFSRCFSWRCHGRFIVPSFGMWTGRSAWRDPNDQRWAASVTQHLVGKLSSLGGSRVLAKEQNHTYSYTWSL